MKKLVLKKREIRAKYTNLHLCDSEWGPKKVNDASCVIVTKLNEFMLLNVNKCGSDN